MVLTAYAILRPEEHKTEKTIGRGVAFLLGRSKGLAGPEALEKEPWLLRQAQEKLTLDG